MFTLNVALSNTTRLILSEYGYPVNLTCMHMLICYLACRWYRLSVLPSSIKVDGLSVLPLSISFSLSIAFGNASLRFIYPSFAHMLGTATPLVVLLLQVTLYRSRFNTFTYLSVPIICIGLLLCSVAESNFSATGLFFSLAATVLRALKTIQQRNLLVQKIPSVQLLEEMAWQSCIILIPIGLAFEGMDPINAIVSSSSHFLALIALNCLNACTLNLVNLSVASITTPVTLQILGNIKSAVSVFASAVFLGNVVSTGQAVGCCLVGLGTALYQWKGGEKKFKTISRESIKQ